MTLLALRLYVSYVFVCSDWNQWWILHFRSCRQERACVAPRWRSIRRCNVRLSRVQIFGKRNRTSRLVHFQLCKVVPYLVRMLAFMASTNNTKQHFLVQKFKKKSFISGSRIARISSALSTSNLCIFSMKTPASNKYMNLIQFPNDEKII